MLTDIERKVLAIIRNTFALRGRPPTIRELCVRTGRSEIGVYYVLNRLTEEEYIEWSRERPGEIKLLQAWERRGHWDWG